MAHSEIAETVSVVIKKPDETKILLVDYDGRGYWLPSSTRQSNENLNSTAKRLARQVYSAYPGQTEHKKQPCLDH